MPPLANQPGVLRVDHHFTIAEDLAAQCRLFMRYTGAAPSNADLSTFATHLMSLWPGAMASLMTPDKNITGIVVTDLTSPTSAIGSDNTTHAGSLLEAILPAATCTMLNIHIHRRYRGGKPRVYWPFGSETRLQDEQTWTAAWLALVLTEINAYEAGSAGQVVGPATIAEWVSISQYAGFTAVVNPITGRTRDVPNPRPVALAPDAATAFSIHPRPTNQRRRALNR